MSKPTINIAIFASGTGSNAQKIVEYFKYRTDVRINLIVSNKKDAGVLHFAENENINSFITNRNSFYQTDELLQVLKEYHIHFIVLAGFLWLIPENLIESFPDRIINIHPSLLPKYGGKGMYGHFVHDAVLQAKEKYSGITIHYVNGKYDEGSIVFQEKCALSPTDDAKEIAKKVQVLEHLYYPKVLDDLLSSLMV